MCFFCGFSLQADLFLCTIDLPPKHNLKAIHFNAELQQSQDWPCAFCLWKMCSDIQDHLIHAQETDGCGRILSCQNLGAFLPKLKLE